MQVNPVLSKFDCSSIKELFEVRAARCQDQLAVVCGDRRLTFRDLNSRANRLAAYLRRFGVSVDVPIGIWMRRSHEMVITVLAVLKAGGAYLPLDPTYPAERLAYMVQDSKTKIILHDGWENSFTDNLPGPGRVEVIDLTEAQDGINTESGENPPLDVPIDSLAYVIYTSGSTGRPKGVLGTHRGMLNRLQWMWQQYPFMADEAGCVKTSLSFLDSFCEIFGPLLQGIPIVVVPDEAVKDTEQFVHELEIHEVTRLVLVPSFLRALLSTIPELGDRLRRIKVWVTSGEALSADLARRFRECLPGARLLNLYGSSEVSADCTWYELGEAEEAGVPIGQPIANNAVYVLDDAMDHASQGAAGELYVGGVGVARGYLGSPALTAERFVPDPFGQPGSRMFRSNDRGRWARGGVLEYLGRSDHLIKIRGFRVEPGEIEAALTRHPSVAQAAVAPFELQPGQKQLVGYVVAEPGVELGPAALRDYLSRQMPDYMVPAVIMPIEALPLTPSGKLDRSALPAPQYAAGNKTPRTAQEKVLTRLFAEVLGLDHHVGADARFFDLGGDSISSMELVSRARKAGLVITARDVFRHQNVTALVAAAMLRQNHEADT